MSTPKKPKLLILMLSLLLLNYSIAFATLKRKTPVSASKALCLQKNCFFSRSESHYYTSIYTVNHKRNNNKRPIRCVLTLTTHDDRNFSTRNARGSVCWVPMPNTPNSIADVTKINLLFYMICVLQRVHRT